MSPVRPGAFNANFAPDTLENFKQHCKQNNKQYTKVLEKLAEIYLQTDGEILSAPDPVATANATRGGVDGNDFNKLVASVEKLAQDIENAYSHLEPLVEDLDARVQSLEK